MHEMREGAFLCMWKLLKRRKETRGNEMSDKVDVKQSANH